MGYQTTRKNYEMYSRDITHWLENYAHSPLNDAAVKALLLGRKQLPYS